MDKVFGELRKLPCHYCRFQYGYSPKCLKRGQEVGDLEICEDMSPDIEIVASSIEHYFEYLEGLKH